MLWRGLQSIALPQLQILLADGPALEKAAASWVLARWNSSLQNLRAAYEQILAFHQNTESIRAVPHPGPFLLGVHLCLEFGDIQRAGAIFNQGFTLYGNTADFVLARLLLRKADQHEAADLSTALRGLYSGFDISPITFASGSGDLFDRLKVVNNASIKEAQHDSPLVSVILPVFNSGPFLTTALRGLQAQTWRNLEILLIDDGSTDGSLKIAQDASEQDSRVKVFALGENVGAYPARNLGLAHARGEFITVHDADDWSHPQKIEVQVRPLIENPSLKATLSHWVRAGNNLEMTRWRVEESWIHRNVSSLMFPRQLRDEIGYWDRVKVNADTEFYYRLIRLYGVESILEVYPGLPLSFGRTTAASLTTNTATHMRTQYSGIRHEYMEAAHHWHRGATAPSRLYLPRVPEKRPFRVPEQISLGDPQACKSDLDLLKETELFDERWYLQANPDVLQGGSDAARHYLEVGASEDRDPGPLFSTSAYRLTYGLQSNENPLLDFLRQRGREPLPVFDGRLKSIATETPCVLVFAHTSGDTLFGAERSLVNVVKRLSKIGLRPVIVVPTLRNKNYLELLRDNSVAVEVLPQIWRTGLHSPNIQTILKIRALIRKYKPQEVHINTCVQEAPAIAARTEGVKSVMYIREMPGEDPDLCRLLKMNAEALRNKLLEQVDWFVMPSQVVANWLNCPERSTVRPNAVDEALFDLAFTPGRFLKIALISSNVEKKGIADCLEAARIIAKSGHPMRFLLIGPMTESLLKLKPFPPNVRFCDYAANPVDAISQADVVLSLSHFAESFGRTVVEAMAAGRPIVCYDRGAPATLVINGKTGLVVQADCVEGVADALLTLDAARMQLTKMSDAARRQARAIQKLALK
jgi:glycosyltransferase involved in cell wall biosynthesis